MAMAARILSRSLISKVSVRLPSSSSSSAAAIAPIHLRSLTASTNLHRDANSYRNEIVDGYIKTLATVVESEEEIRMKMYSVSTKHNFAFEPLVSEELSYKINGEPFINAENLLGDNDAAQPYRGNVPRHSYPTNIQRNYLSHTNYTSQNNMRKFSWSGVGSFTPPNPSIYPLQSSMSPTLYQTIGRRAYSSSSQSGGSSGKPQAHNHKRTRFMKQRKGTMKGICHGGSDLAFGTYGLKALEHSWITSRQIEAGRRALIRNVRRDRKIWVRMYPYKSVSKKPNETRMGRGKGNISHWVAVVKPGKILYEIGGVAEAVARKAIQLAASKLPKQTRFVLLK